MRGKHVWTFFRTSRHIISMLIISGCLIFPRSMQMAAEQKVKIIFLFLDSLSRKVVSFFSVAAASNVTACEDICSFNHSCSILHESFTEITFIIIWKIACRDTSFSYLNACVGVTGMPLSMIYIVWKLLPY